MTAKQKLQDKIEHLGAFEERCSVRIENISIKVSESYTKIVVFFELYSTSEDNKLKQETRVNVVFYDYDEKILDYNSTFIYPSDFWGFAVDYVNMNVYSDEADKISKIRIYPSSWG
jgi:hypothetical protein